MDAAYKETSMLHQKPLMKSLKLIDSISFGEYAMINGHPCQVTYVTDFQGDKKEWCIQGHNIFTDKFCSSPVLESCQAFEVPNVITNKGYPIAIFGEVHPVTKGKSAFELNSTPDQFVSLATEDTGARITARIQAEHAVEIRAAMELRKNIVITVTSALGQSRVTFVDDVDNPRRRKEYKNIKKRVR